MADTVQQIKDKLSIVDVVSQYVKLERAGQGLRARCPFHAEKTPSFHVSPERGTYHCFGCGVGGDIFSFVEAIEGLDFKGALKVLAERAGVEIIYSRGGKEQKDGRDRLFELMEAATIFYVSRLTDAAKGYLKERGISEETFKQFRLGLAGESWSEASDYLKQRKYSDTELLDAGISKKNERGSLTDKFRNRIMFPIADSAGRIVGFSGRIFGEKASPDAPKYLNSPETPLFHKSKILYGFDRAKQSIRKHQCAVLVEGQMDLLASHQAGWSNTIAVSGTAFTQDHATLIKRMTDNLVLALDADEAGIKAAGRAARAALQSGLNVKVAKLPAGLDPADLIQKEGKETWSKAIRDSKDIITFLLDVLEEHAKNKDAFRRAVEAIVLPFLADVSSPIAREHYEQEISERLMVSREAIVEALAKVPRVPNYNAAPESRPNDASYRENKTSPRSHHAYGILRWQQKLAQPQLDLTRLEREFEEAVGTTTSHVLQQLPEKEKEALIFAAERMYAKPGAPERDLERETKTLLDVLLKERLTADLKEATEALKNAENTGDAKQAAVYIDVCKVLTTRIAKLHEKG
ncbi:MAG: primase, primase protein [Candidatus Parcubacteria bacterium]|jgi:DNA primase